MQKNFASLPSFETITGALSAAGLSAFLSHPVWIHGPSVLQAIAKGKINLSARPATETPAAAAAGGSSWPPWNDLKIHDIAPDNKIAVQPVEGIIYGGASDIEEWYYWLFNLDRLHHTIARVQGDATIKALILKMNTPGGSVLGLHAVATALQGLTAARPDMAVVTYTQTLCASAGMYLAAACQEIHSAPGAYVGSIGTIAELSDWSGFKQKIGLETRRYTADSKLKDLGSSPIKEEHDAYMSEIVGKYSAEFKAWMTERRGLAADDMHGQCWEARLAPEGMVDSAYFTTFEQFLAAALL